MNYSLIKHLVYCKKLILRLEETNFKLFKHPATGFLSFLLDVYSGFHAGAKGSIDNALASHILLQQQLFEES